MEGVAATHEDDAFGREVVGFDVVFPQVPGETGAVLTGKVETTCVGDFEAVSGLADVGASLGGFIRSEGGCDGGGKGNVFGNVDVDHSEAVGNGGGDVSLSAVELVIVSTSNREIESVSRKQNLRLGYHVTVVRS